MLFRVSRCFLSQNSCVPIAISRSMRLISSVTLNTFCNTTQKECYKAAYLLPNIHLYSIVEARRFASSTNRSKENNKLSHLRQKRISNNTAVRQKYNKLKHNVRSAQQQQQQQKPHLPKSKRLTSKASAKRNGRHNSCPTAVACDTHKKTKRATLPSTSNTARLTKTRKGTTIKVSASVRRRRKTNVFKKHKRKNAYQRQRVKYNKRVATIANLWKEHKEAESMKRAQTMPFSSLDGTTKVASKYTDASVRSSIRKKEETIT